MTLIKNLDLLAFYNFSLKIKLNCNKENMSNLTLFRISLFGAVHQGGIPKIGHTYPMMMKLCTVIPYPKKNQKTYESRDTPLEFR